jgi:hypothetical protein
MRQLVPLTWWLNPSSLRLEDLVFSIIIDIVAAAGELQLRWRHRLLSVPLFGSPQQLNRSVLSYVHSIAPALQLW